MKSPSQIQRTPGLSPDHMLSFCIMSPLSRQQSFRLQVKRICQDSSFVTLMSFSAKLSLPARCFPHCFGSHGRTLNNFCNRLPTAKRYVTWLVSNHHRSNHDRRIMSENPGVYIAMKSAVFTQEPRLDFLELSCLATSRVHPWLDGCTLHVYHFLIKLEGAKEG